MRNFKFNKENIISLWQNPYYSDVLLNMYKIVNNFLIKREIKVSKTKFEKLDIDMNFFKDFLIKYINSITNILYKSPKKSIIVYRGENRESFDVKENDILFYKNFHSTSYNISTSFNFSINIVKPENLRIVLALEIPDGFYYEKLNKPVEYYNKKYDIKEFYDEYEYLIPPNSYYQITKIIKLSNRLVLVKAVLIRQEKYIFAGPEDYYIPTQPKVKKINDFPDKNINTFVLQFKRYEKTLLVLENMKEYQIPHKLYLFIKKYQKNIIVKKEIDELNELIELIESINENIINELGQDDDFNNDTNSIRKINIRNLSLDIKKISDIKVYTGIDNINFKLEKMKISNIFKDKKTGILDKVIVSKLIPDCYYYDCVINDMFPRTSILKNKKKITIYTKFILELELINVRILITQNPELYYDTTVLLIPRFEYKVVKVVKSKNKYNLPIYIVKVRLIGI